MLRFFTVYGPWGRPDMALFKFTKNILENKPIDVYNYGNHMRGFTYVETISHVINKMIKFKRSKNYEIYNIGGSESIKLMDFSSNVRAVRSLIGLGSQNSRHTPKTRNSWHDS